MTFDWNHYLVLAKKLVAEKDDAALRSAVSRSYYCVFNLAMTRAKSNEYRTKDDASSHDQLWSLYERNTENAACRQLSLIGARMKRRRVNADYRTVYSNLKGEAEDAIEDAEECIKLLHGLPKEFPKDIPRRYSFGPSS